MATKKNGSKKPQRTAQKQARRPGLETRMKPRPEAESPEYKAAAAVRDEASKADIMIIEGYDGPQPGA